jgi:hypothetical protein
MSCGDGHLGFPIGIKNRHLVKDIPMIKLFTFQASSPKPLGQLEPILAGMFLGWSSTKMLFFVLVGYSTWPPPLYETHVFVASLPPTSSRLAAYKFVCRKPT